MYVPPFVPQQIEIPGNVATEPYMVRLGFIRRVVVAYSISVGLVVGLSYLSIVLPLMSAALLTLGSLLALSLVRGLVKGKTYEQIISGLVAPFLFFGISQMIATGPERGWPQWAVGIGPLGILIYTCACGRDLSFMGMFVLTGVFQAISLAIFTTMGFFEPRIAVEVGLIGMALVFFLVYDLAALLTRRRLGEEVGAVLDLYRDVLNFSTYTVRVIRHWRKHRIWSLK
jgi:hypothetical protein